MTGGSPGGDLQASVIVPARDGADVVARLMSALTQQSLPPESFEVIIGDDGSADPTIGGLETSDRVRIASGPAIGGYAARNRAASLARSPVLAFCDSDCVPERTWLEAGLAAIVDADVVAGFIRGIGADPPTLWTMIDMDTFVDQERAVQAGGLLTGNLLVRREFFERLGGFDESLPRTGDYEFSGRCRAAGARVAFCREAVVGHPTYDAAGGFLRKFWGVNRWYGWREGRAGRRPSRLKLREWVPLVQTVRSRRLFGKTLGLDRGRLRENGVTPRIGDDLKAFPIVYLLLPYMANVAQLAGWLAGRRLTPTAGVADFEVSR